MDRFGQIQEDAIEALSYEFVLGLFPHDVHCKLFLGANGFPFSNPVSYAIVQKSRRTDGDSLVVRCRWRSDLDNPRNPLDEMRLAVLQRDPTIEIHVADCPPGWIEEVMAPFRDFSIPMAPKQSMGLDGVTFNLVLGDLFGGLRLNWWCNGPKEWKPVVDHARSLLENIESDKFTFEIGPLAFSYAVDLAWKPPGVQASDLEGIRALVPACAQMSVSELLKEIRGSTYLRVGLFKKNEAIIKCNMAAEYGFTAEMKRSKV